MAKYTDEQIKKALELCVNWKSEYCLNCPLTDECDNDSDALIRNTLDLIKRQEAEIERLEKQLYHAEVCIDELEYAYEKVGDSNSRVDEALEKYNLAKEMVGEGE